MDRSARHYNKQNRSGIILNGIYVGFVRNNDDVQRMGRLSVYIPELCEEEEEGSPDGLFIVSYCSPFAGVNPQEGTSYGFWAVPPDLGNRVLVCFANNDPAQGFWLGCLYEQFMNHMVPGLGDAKGGAASKEYEKGEGSPSDVWNPEYPQFEPLFNGITMQGLQEDAERGFSSTSAKRAGVSNTYGLLSPRGNTIHIDDDEANEFIRFRTRSGVQLLIHETNGYIYMISKNGDSWAEISDKSIDLFSKKSINLTAEENINIHAEQNISFHSNGGLHAAAENITIQSKGKIEMKAEDVIERSGPQINDNTAQAGDQSSDEESEEEGAEGAEDGEKDPSMPDDLSPDEIDQQNTFAPGNSLDRSKRSGDLEDVVLDKPFKKSDGSTSTPRREGFKTYEDLFSKGGQAYAGGAISGGNDPNVTYATAYLAKDVPGFQRVTGQNDLYHHTDIRYTSDHTKGTKVDVTFAGGWSGQRAAVPAIRESFKQRFGAVEGVHYNIISKQHGNAPHVDIGWTTEGIALIERHRTGN